MSGFASLLGDWHFWLIQIAYIAFANAISALPMPDTTSGKFYGWAFKFLNGFASNFARAAAGKIPGTGDVMPLPGAQQAVQNAAVVAKAADAIANPVVVEVKSGK
jgi:hypothetical protein